MKIFQKSILLIFFFVFFAGFALASVYAEALVPCGNGDGIRAGGFLEDECSVCHLQVLAMNVINFFVLITAVVAALLFVNAGVLYVMSSANPGNIARAHKIFMTTLAGAVLVFAAWLLINTIMMGLVNGSDFTGWNNTLCTGNMVYTPPPATPPPSTPTTPTLPTGPATPFGTATETGARTIFADAGITVNAPPPQTTLEGLQVHTVAGAIGLRDALGMPLVVTGGTEGGVHADGELSHPNGYKLDFGTNSNPGLTPAVMQSVLNSGTETRSNGEVGYIGYIEGKRVVAYYEDPGTANAHWDVTFHEGM